jgi:hypothetical protein
MCGGVVVVVVFFSENFYKGIFYFCILVGI